MIFTLIMIALIVMGLNWASSNHVKNVRGAFDVLLSTGALWGGFVLAAVLVAPFLYRYGRPLLEQNWAPIVNEVGSGAKTILAAPPPRPYSAPPVSAPAPTIVAYEMPAAPPPAVVVAPASADPVIVMVNNDEQYTVKPGDNLRKIADRFGVTVDSIVAANNLTNANVIMPGQVLIIRKVTEVVVTPTPAPAPTAVAEIVPEVAAVAPTAVAEPNLENDMLIMGGYKLNGDIDAASAHVDMLIRRYPDNSELSDIRSEIDAAIARRQTWQKLGQRAEDDWNSGDRLVYDETQADVVSEYLSGYEFVIVDYQNAWGMTANREVMRVRCITPTWMNGTEFDLQAVHATSRGARKIGDTFTVSK